MEQTLIGKNFEKVKDMLPHKGRRTEKIIFKKKIHIGYDLDKYAKYPIFLECEIKNIDLSTEVIFDGSTKEILTMGNTKETIKHEKINNYNLLSISGTSRRFGGQIIDCVENLTGAKPELKEIIKNWREWHLNDLQPNCIHQNSFDCNKDFENRAKIETKKCPKNYHYGSKWLIKEIPKEVIEHIIDLFTTYNIEGK